MAENSDVSEACSSESEDEGTLEQHEYERRRELYMSKMIFCEKKFLELKPLLLKLKLSELNKFQEELRNRTAESYLNKKALLDEEFNKKRKHVNTLRILGLEQFRRLDEGRLQMIEDSRENNIDLAKYEIRQTIIEKFNKQKEIERITGLCNGIEDSSNGYVEPEENISRYLYRDPKTEETLWRNIPVVIEQLAQHLIEEDLKAFEDSETKRI